VGNRLKALRDGATAKYIYDKADNLLAETNNAGVITRYYIHGQGMLAFVEGNAAYTYHHDAVGNTMAVTDGLAAVKNAYAYTPYGRVTNKQEAIAQTFQFAGQFGVMTETNGLLYMRARYYDPKIGRFLSEDPSGFDGGLNLYAYTGNSPMMRVDPSGEAYLQIRPLDVTGLRNTTAYPFNHAGFIYDDGRDSGYYADGQVRRDNSPIANKYESTGQYLQDDILHQAENNINVKWNTGNPDDYSKFTHNCHDYTNAVLNEYDRVLRTTPSSWSKKKNW